MKAKMKDKEFKEEQSRRVREGLAASKKKGGRPYLPLNLEKALEWLNRGDSVTDVATNQNMSYTTLKRRLDAVGVKKVAAVYAVGQKEDKSRE